MAKTIVVNGFEVRMPAGYSIDFNAVYAKPFTETMCKLLSPGGECRHIQCLYNSLKEDDDHVCNDMPIHELVSVDWP